MKKENQKVVPNHLQIETINGICTAQCNMCTIDSWTRKPNCMTNEELRSILYKFVPYIDHLDFLTLHFCGEPLLDKELPGKISIAKKLGFRGIGFATNCTELDEKLSLRLIKSGLDTIICSIDGIKKQTHEAIRRKTNFERIVQNVKAFINIRNNISGKGGTRILIRFIRQKLNWDEWPVFYTEWRKYINPEKGDDVIRFDVHNWGDKIDEYEEKTCGNEISSNLACSDIFERFLVYSNGNVGFCCADDNGFFRLGNVIEDDPIEIYNNEIFSKYRISMKTGRIQELDHCKSCTIMRSRMRKTSPKTKYAGR